MTYKTLISFSRQNFNLQGNPLPKKMLKNMLRSLKTESWMWTPATYFFHHSKLKLLIVQVTDSVSLGFLLHLAKIQDYYNFFIHYKLLSTLHHNYPLSKNIERECDDFLWNSRYISIYSEGDLCLWESKIISSTHVVEMWHNKQNSLRYYLCSEPDWRIGLKGFGPGAPRYVEDPNSISCSCKADVLYSNLESNLIKKCTNCTSHCHIILVECKSIS